MWKALSSITYPPGRYLLFHIVGYIKDHLYKVSMVFGYIVWRYRTRIYSKSGYRTVQYFVIEFSFKYTGTWFV